MFHRSIKALLPFFVLGVAIFGSVHITTAQDEATENWELDSSHTSIYFKISHLGTSMTFGRFNEVSGSFTTGPGASFEFTVPAASIDTNHAERDNHLRSPDFFNVKQFPIITFKSTNVEIEGDVYHVIGDLQLHGVTQSISIEMRKNKQITDPWGATRTGFDTEFMLKRSDYGMTNMLDMIGDEVTLAISFEGTM